MLTSPFPAGAISPSKTFHRKKENPMLHRAVTCVLFGLALAVFATATQAAEEDKTHEGVVVSASAGKLVMSDKEGQNEHSHIIGETAKITLDGKAAKLADLKKGDKVKVTAGADGKVTAVAATRKEKK
jgi:hypothetical protein